jgi:hypothetical protein
LQDLTSTSVPDIILGLHATTNLPSADLLPAVTPLLGSKTLLGHSSSTQNAQRSGFAFLCRNGSTRRPEPWYSARARVIPVGYGKAGEAPEEGDRVWSGGYDAKTHETVDSGTMLRHRSALTSRRNCIRCEQMRRGCSWSKQSLRRPNVPMQASSCRLTLFQC